MMEYVSSALSWYNIAKHAYKAEPVGEQQDAWEFPQVYVLVLVVCSFLLLVHFFFL